MLGGFIMSGVWSWARPKLRSAALTGAHKVVVASYPAVGQAEQAVSDAIQTTSSTCQREALSTAMGVSRRIDSLLDVNRHSIQRGRDALARAGWAACATLAAGARYLARRGRSESAAHELFAVGSKVLYSATAEDDFVELAVATVLSVDASRTPPLYAIRLDEDGTGRQVEGSRLTRHSAEGAASSGEAGAAEGVDASSAAPVAAASAGPAGGPSAAFGEGGPVLYSPPAEGGALAVEAFVATFLSVDASRTLPLYTIRLDEDGTERQADATCLAQPPPAECARRLQACELRTRS